ncbi:beta-ketoacyl-ACP synthase III [Sulfurovum sp. bin170]|uniref:beta-ketoacyl-ACP synthase III n=1 Tax=Sulfurovum sp. bin170 TaxID=2695268 RepID=UPI0013DFF25F|nr:beta-ketoacyl-ACP synthase III [Sulfurovum sp. bin170]
MNSVYINKIAKFLPNEPISNDEMESVLGKIGGKPSKARRIILRSNGIKKRYYVMDKEQNIRYNNAQITANAIRNLGIDVDDIETLVCGTTMADQIMPNHAVMVHGELGSKPCEVVGTAGICLSGITALKYAYQSIKSEESSFAVSTGSEVASTILHAKNFEKESEFLEDEFKNRPEIAFEKDFLRWMLSDGAGAMLLQNRPNPDGLSLKIEWIDILSFANELEVCMYAGAIKEDGRLKGYKEFTQDKWIENSIFTVKQDVRLLNNMVSVGVKSMKSIMEKRGIVADEVDWFLSHYSSNYFKDKSFVALNEAGIKIPKERWFSNLTTCGNTGSASIYIMIEELFNTGMLSKGEKILCYVPESGRFSSSLTLLEVV